MGTIRSQEGFRTFNVQLADTGVCKTYFRHQLNRLPDLKEFDDMDDDLFMNYLDEYEAVLSDDEAPVEREPEPEPEARPKRFVDVESDMDVDMLADEAQSKATTYQTTWAVNVFRGQFLFSIISLM